MAGSITFNSYDLSAYMRVTWPYDMMTRLPDIIQLQEQAYAGKAQKGPRRMALPVIITGTSLSNLTSNYETVRGYLDSGEGEDCALSFDSITNRYWMAQFEDLNVQYTSDRTMEGTLTFLLTDTKAYAATPSAQVETLTTNVSDGYGGTIRGICFDSEGEFVYVAGATTEKVYKLSSIDLTFVAEGPAYGGTIYCICDGGDGYIYYGGDGGAGEYDICKLLKSDMTTIVRGPDYGGVIYCCCNVLDGDYIFYGGDGGAGQFDVSKLLKSDMTTELRGPDYGGTIYGIAVDSTGTYLYYGGNGGAGQYDIDKLDVATMAVEVRGPDSLGIIRDIAVDATYVYGCGDIDKIQRLDVATMAVETLSADLGSDLNALVIDDDYIWAVGDDQVVYKLDIDFAASASHIAKSAVYGGNLYAIAIDTTNQRLYIGGDTTETVWKLDTRHLELSGQSVVVGDNVACGRAICEDDVHIFTVTSYGAGLASVVKINKQTLDIVNTSATYGAYIHGIYVDDSFVYIVGEYDGPGGGLVRQLTKDTLSFVADGPAYGGTVYCICGDNDYIYYGGNGGLGQYDICKLLKSDMTTIVRGPDYGGIIYCCCELGGYVYYGGNGGAGQYDMCKLLKSDMTTIVRSNDYGGIIYCCDNDGSTYIYYGGATTNTVRRTDIATMAVDTDSNSLGGTIYSVQSDANYTYAGTATTQTVYKLQNSDVSIIAETGAYSSTIYTVSIYLGYLYIRNGDDYCIDVLDTRVLWTRADHEFTVTTSGTSKTEPILTITYSADNDHQQVIGNETTGDEFDWDGSVDSADEMEIDSGLYYATVNGESAMTGQSGDFIKLAAGANSIRTENIVGSMTFDWADRFA